MRGLRTLAAFAAAILAASPALSQDFPGGKTVTMIVPFAPGGVTDVAARVAADGLAKLWGVPVIVENIGGGGGITGIQALIARKADGYTIANQVTTLAGQSVLLKHPPVDVLKELIPISQFAEGTGALVARKDAPFSNLAELKSYAKAHPRTLNYSHVGPGTAMMAIETVNQKLGIDAQGIAYKGAAESYTALLSGEVDLTSADLGRALEDIRAGKVKIIGVTGKARSKFAPDLPTLYEQDLEGSNGYFIGFFIRAGTPQPIVDKIERDLITVTRSPETAEKMRNFTIDLVGSSSQEFRKLIVDTISDWTVVFNKLGLEKL